jgi:hypothetical protein
MIRWALNCLINLHLFLFIFKFCSCINTKRYLILNVVPNTNFEIHNQRMLVNTLLLKERIHWNILFFNMKSSNLIHYSTWNLQFYLIIRHEIFKFNSLFDGQRVEATTFVLGYMMLGHVTYIHTHMHACMRARIIWLIYGVNFPTSPFPKWILAGIYRPGL